MLVDGDPATRWLSGRPQAGNEWIRIELDRPRELAEVPRPPALLLRALELLGEILAELAHAQVELAHERRHTFLGRTAQAAEYDHRETHCDQARARSEARRDPGRRPRRDK